MLIRMERAALRNCIRKSFKAPRRAQTDRNFNSRKRRIQKDECIIYQMLSCGLWIVAETTGTQFYLGLPIFSSLFSFFSPLTFADCVLWSTEVEFYPPSCEIIYIQMSTMQMFTVCIVWLGQLVLFSIWRKIPRGTLRIHIISRCHFKVYKLFEAWDNKHIYYMHDRKCWSETWWGLAWKFILIYIKYLFPFICFSIEFQVFILPYKNPQRALLLLARKNSWNHIIRTEYFALRLQAHWSFQK